MATSTRVTRSKGESDGLSLPMRSRPTRRDATSGRNEGTALSTSGWEHQQQMPTQMPHLTQSPEAAPGKRTATPPMLPPGPHRPLTPCMPLPASPTSSLRSSAPLFQEDRYSSTSESTFHVQTPTLNINAPPFPPNLHQAPLPPHSQSRPNNFYTNPQQTHTTTSF